MSYSITKKEDILIKEIEDIFLSNEDLNTRREDFERLLKEYKKSSRQLKRVIKMSDKQQEELNDKKSTLESLSYKLDSERKKLEQINKHTKDSIEYAAMIQQTLIPDKNVFERYFQDYLSIWQPKDIVGGDIYLFEHLRDDNECLLMVIDCTGHGVPGAFVTMLVKAIERQVVSKIVNNKSLEVSPAWILSYFNQALKKLLKQEDSKSVANAGFDGGILYYNKLQKTIKYSGAETPLFYFDADHNLHTIKGSRHSIGYKKSDPNYKFKEHIIDVEPHMKFFLSTDGYIDQNGGAKGFPFGKKRLKTILEHNHYKTFDVIEKELYTELHHYQGDQERNDDITLIGFKV